MSIKNLNLRTPVLIGLILSVGIWRIFISSGYSFLTNFTPLGAMALFGGYYLKNKWQAFFIPIITLWVSDIILNSFIYGNELKFFYKDFIYIYLSFMLIVLFGRIMKFVSLKNIFIYSVYAALAHWLISDLGVWLSYSIYPNSFNGLVMCYIAAIPFMLKMLIGNIVFSAILFGIFEYSQYKFKPLQIHNN